MELAEVLRRRRMVRRYGPDPVPEDVLERVLAAAAAAPTAGNSGGQHLVVVTAAPTREAVARLAGEEEYVARGVPAWLSTAPVHVVLVALPDEYRRRYAAPDKRRATPPDAWPVPYWWVDAGATLLALLLAAVDEGLGAGFLGIHAFAPGLGSLLDLPPGAEPVGVVTLGRPVTHLSPAPPRPAAARRIHRDTWQPGPDGNAGPAPGTSFPR